MSAQTGPVVLTRCILRQGFVVIGEVIRESITTSDFSGCETWLLSHSGLSARSHELRSSTQTQLTQPSLGLVYILHEQLRSTLLLHTVLHTLAKEKPPLTNVE